MEQSSERRAAMLTIKIDGGDGWFRAKCEELDVYGSGETKRKAVESLFVSMFASARFRTIEGRGTEHTRQVLDNKEDLWKTVPAEVIKEITQQEQALSSAKVVWVVQDIREVVDEISLFLEREFGEKIKVVRIVNENMFHFLILEM